MNRQMAEQTGEFLKRHFPRDLDGSWPHSFISAWQMACELLDALGYARETPWGAIPFNPPVLPEVLPRRDDVCVTLLKVGEQGGLIDFFHESDAPCNIRSAPGLGSAMAHPDLLSLFEALEVVSDGAWSESAEMLLWRNWPYEWPELRLDFDPRILSAAAAAGKAMPEDVRADLEAAAAHSDPLIRYFFAVGVFHRRWRIGEGWLGDGGPRALDIFHDPLASLICRLVTGHTGRVP